MNGITKSVGLFRSALSRHLAITQSTTKRQFPICTVDISKPKNEIPDKFIAEFRDLIAASLKKPVELVTVVVRSESDVIRGLDMDHSVLCQLWSVGVFDEERNPGYSKQYIDFMMSKLDIPFERVAVLFHPIERHQAGHLLYAAMKKS